MALSRRRWLSSSRPVGLQSRHSNADARRPTKRGRDMTEIRKLGYFVGNEWRESKTIKYMDCYDPSTGQVIAQAPQCTAQEVEEAIECAQNAFGPWADTPASKRVQVLFRMKALLD